MWWRMDGKAQLVVEYMDGKAQLEVRRGILPPFASLLTRAGGLFYNASSVGVINANLIKYNEACTFHRVL
jgi:hypothetical protein